MYVTPQGLSTLLRSANAKSFTRDPTDKLRSRVLAHDGRLEAIEAALATTGFADVVVTGASDADIDLLPDASIHLRESPAAATQAQAARASIQSSLVSMAVLKHDPASPASSNARINREAFVALREHPNVRSIHLAGWSDERPSDWQHAVLDEAAQQGSVDALIELRLPAPIVMATKDLLMEFKVFAWDALLIK
ncbi:MAG: hypothetical protein V4787_10970 [Pseudomonadota bacterium]